MAQGKPRRNTPPTVTITSPANGTTFNSPATIAISANASDVDGTVTRIDFFAGGTLLGTDNTAPFTFTWSNVGAGTYSITARATDDKSARTTSTAVNVTVGPNSNAASGLWSPLIDFPNPSGCSGCAFAPIHMHLLSNGRVLMWQDDNDSGSRGAAADTVAYVWDVQSNTFTRVYNVNTDLFCSGHAFLPDGRLLVAGGHAQSDNNGTTTTNLFDPATNSWSLSNFSMNQGRWYPTVTALPTREMLVASGNISTTQGVNTIPEVWSSSTGWRQLTSAALAQPLYPWMHVAPNGSVFNSG